MKEEWKDIIGYEGYYKISNCGRVRRVGGKILKPYKYHGYDGVWLCKLGKRVRKKNHRLVLEVFVGPSSPGNDGRHLDGNKENNNLDNLAWGTRSQNEADKVRHGRSNRGSRDGMSKLCELDVWLIKNIHVKHRILAEFFGVTRSNITMIKTGRSWTHV